MRRIKKTRRRPPTLADFAKRIPESAKSKVIESIGDFLAYSYPSLDSFFKKKQKK